MSIKEIKVPDMGGAKEAEVIEILVKPGSKVTKDESIITLESEKASMEVPSPYDGTVKEIKVKVGDKIAEGHLILTLEVEGEDSESATEKVAPAKSEPAKKAEGEAAKEESTKEELSTKESKVETKATSPAPAKPAQETFHSHSEVHAGPGVRQFARELGVDLNQLAGSGRKERITREDVQAYVKQALSQRSTGGFALPEAPQVDFAKFGEVETKSLSKIKKLTGVYTHRSWVTVPHVTQFDEADITELEAFRVANKTQAEKQGYKLTPLVFIMKAVVAALKKFPNFNASLDSSGENLILKKYFHLGVAVETPNGLVVPVIRDVDKKGLAELAQELAKISTKAREKGLSPNEMQGSTFTISSLGGIGGTAFTPIVNAPDVAILGVSKSMMKPVFVNENFVPRLMLPLSLSYDHRVIDGAEGARFTIFLAEYLSDIRKLLL